MENEIVDLLDENGKVLGSVEKDKAHKEGLWHKSVHVWIINNNQVLLQQRCAAKNFYPNVWDVSFAGHVSAGEDSITSAIREGEEELGINIDTSKLTYLFMNKEMLSYNDIRSNEFVDIYLLKQDINIEDIVLQDSEVGGVKYVKVEDFINMIESRDKDLFPHIGEYERLINFIT